MDFVKKRWSLRPVPFAMKLQGEIKLIVVRKYGGTMEIARALSLEPSLDEDRWPQKANIGGLAPIKMIGRHRNAADHGAPKARDPDNGKLRGSKFGGMRDR
jgi:hypothetical protein